MAEEYVESMKDVHTTSPQIACFYNSKFILKTQPINAEYH